MIGCSPAEPTSSSDLCSKDSEKIYLKLGKQHRRGNLLYPDYLNIAATSFYDCNSAHLLATKHSTTLDYERVIEYKKILRKGKRPAIIALEVIDEHGFRNSFILDGHHKAKAYIEEKINPAIIFIQGRHNTSEEIISDLIIASQILYREQMEYLIKSNFENDPIIDTIFENKLLNQFCLHGEVRKLFPNGNLRFIGNHIKTKRDGICEWYYPDGSIEKRIEYQNGKYLFTHVHYFHNGQLLLKANKEGVIEQYDIYGNKKR